MDETSAAPADPIIKNFDDLVQVLHDRHGGLSQSHRDISEFVRSHPDRCAFMTITELSTELGVNESTISRFVRRVGLTGYTELTNLCGDHLVHQSQFLTRLERLEKLSDVGQGDMLERAVHGDLDNLTKTYARIDPERWTAAVTALAESRRVYVIGLRKCFAIAHHLAYALGLVRDDVRLLALNDGSLPEQVRSIGPDDTCVAISIRRYTKEVVQTLAFAHGRSATTIALTDDAMSPLIPYADLTFYAEAEGASVLRSLTAFMSLAQTLTTATVRHLGTKSRSGLMLQEDLLKEFETYHSPE